MKKPAKTPPAHTPITPEEHSRRMGIDRDYAEHFIRNSMPKGKEFTVVFQCDDPLASQELFAACKTATEAAANPGEGRPVKQIAGCRVVGIYTDNVPLTYQQFRQRIVQFAQSGQ